MTLRSKPVFARSAMVAALAMTFAAGAAQAARLSIGSVTAIERDTAVSVTVPVSLSAPAAGDVTFRILARNNTAEKGSDFGNLARTVTIPAGETSATVRLRIIGDTEAEGTESISLIIPASSITGADARTARAEATVLDDDIFPGALVGTLGPGNGTARNAGGTADPYSLENYVLVQNSNNGTNLNGSIKANGLPRVGQARTLELTSGQRFVRPSTWPVAVTNGDAGEIAATQLPVPDYITGNRYIGAFDPSLARDQQWTAGWTVDLNGNADVWRFHGGEANTALASAMAPVADGSCPAGTTLTGSFSGKFGPLGNDETGLFDGIQGDYDICSLPRELATSLTLTNDNVYELANGFPGSYVGAGYRQRGAQGFNLNEVVLTIQPGTVIYGEPTEALTIARGSKIVAEGTADAPIVFTSANQLASRFDGSLVTPADTGLGEWAGLAMVGQARSQECAGNDFANCDRPLEGNVGFFGGNNDNDSSGSLKYVIVRHAGNDIDGAGNELNGITMGSVGRATRMQYIQIHKGFDDGIEFFGGNAFVANLVVTAVGDDSIDFAQGWTGGVQYALVIQEDSASPGLGRGIEGGDDTTYTSFPNTFPLLANITVLGPANRMDGGAINDRQGMILRGGVRTQLHNSLVTGNFKDSNSSSGVCLDVDATSTFARNDDIAGNGALLFRNNIFDCVSTFELNG